MGLQFFAFIITFIDSNEFHLCTIEFEPFLEIYEDPMCSLQIVSCRYLDPVVRHIKGMPQCDKIYNKQNGSVRPSKQNVCAHCTPKSARYCFYRFTTEAKHSANKHLLLSFYFPNVL